MAPPTSTAPDTFSAKKILAGNASHRTAVEEFTVQRERGQLPGHTGRHRNLIPSSAPGKKEQYAFEVDLDLCTGCKACVTACHAMNGLEEEESWRRVGMLLRSVEPVTPTENIPSAEQFSFPSEGLSMQHVTTACHHCLEPACAIGCPVLAYEKVPATGIVRHLDDQCIGCQYCVFMCPYEVPRYSERLGIVRKCDMCSQRLEAGEPPACVQACPNEAIQIRILGTDPSEAHLHFDPTLALSSTESIAVTLVPGAPDSKITRPTTRYVTNRADLRQLQPADHEIVHPAHAHHPLVLMLLASQLSVGIWTVGWMVLAWGGSGLGFRPVWITAQASLIFSLLAGGGHLGRPERAWRSFLGWRRSWLSREVMGFGAYATMLAAMGFAGWGLGDRTQDWPWWFNLGVALTALTGIAGVFCSIKLYAVTQRPYWEFARTLGRFVGTTALLGLTTMAMMETLAHPAASHLWWAITGLSLLKISWELEILRHRRPSDDPALTGSAKLLHGALSLAWKSRLALGSAGAMTALVSGLNLESSWSWIFGGLTCVLILAGEWLERYLFFVAVVPPRMPGGVAP